MKIVRRGINESNLVRKKEAREVKKLSCVEKGRAEEKNNVNWRWI